MLFFNSFHLMVMFLFVMIWYDSEPQSCSGELVGKSMMVLLAKSYSISSSRCYGILILGTSSLIRAALLSSVLEEGGQNYSCEMGFLLHRTCY